MAKTNNYQAKPILLISNSDFKNQLSERIELGEELFNRPINTHDELDKLQYDYRLWNDYNTEFLQQAFDIPKNEYARNQVQAGFSFVVKLGKIQGNPIQTKRNLLKYKLDNLQSLSTKSSLIKSSVNNVAVESEKKTEINMSQVFIVHGHDNLTKVEKIQLSHSY